ncbi:MAG: alginate O-acetyltransferase AlgX-related protein, partial [Candidatus Binatia bacterium]
LLGELALRIGGFSPIHVNPLNSFHEADPLVGYRGKPNFSGRFRRPEFDVNIKHDQNGFRKQEHQHAKEKSKHRVLIFGDSFTWGWGVGQGKVFTDQMNAWMPDYRIMNFGLNGSGTVQQFTIFEALAQDMLRPGDTVALVFVGNDFTDNVIRFLRAEVKDGQVRRVGPTRLLGTKGDFDLKYVSYLYNYVVFSAAVLKATIEEKRARKKLRKLIDLHGKRKELMVAQHFLAEFDRLVEQKQASFLVVYVPQQGELHETAELDETEARNESTYRRAFQACAETLKLRTLDLLPYFLEAKNLRPGERLTFGRDKHWNENGHALAAKVIAENILAMDRKL